MTRVMFTGLLGTLAAVLLIVAPTRAAEAKTPEPYAVLIGGPHPG